MLEGALVIAPFLPKFSKLRLLSINANYISPDGGQDVLTTISGQSGLTYINFANNQIEATAVFSLVVAIKTLSKLPTLLLEKNTFEAAGKTALCKEISSLDNLTELGLEYNHLGHEDAFAVAVVLPSLTKFMNLDVSDNKIGDAGAKALSNAVKQNGNLTRLGLNFNLIVSGLRSNNFWAHFQNCPFKFKSLVKIILIIK